MRHNRSIHWCREWLFSQPGFWRGCASADEIFAEQAKEAGNETEHDAFLMRANRHLMLADSPNARNQTDLTDW